ncbi:MAG: hypothetical protein KGL77_04775 [Actinomycetales bacterium]|nr:hypothetical protein [Actinomycetales bacterium]
MVKRNSNYRKLYPSRFKKINTVWALALMVMLFGGGMIVGNAITLKPAPIVPGDVLVAGRILTIDDNGQGTIQLAGGAGEFKFYYATDGIVTKKVVVGHDLKPGMYVEFAIGLEGLKGYYNNTKHLQLVTDATLVDGKY